MTRLARYAFLSIAIAMAAADAGPCMPAPTVAGRLFTTADPYACYTIDPSRNRLFFNANFSDPRLAYLSAQVGNGPVRLGGAGGDLLTFATMENGTSCGTLPKSHECLNTSTLDSLLALSGAAASPYVFGLNLVPIGGGGPTRPWNSSNAEALLTYIRDHSPVPLAGIELGNEQNDYGFTAEEQAAAFQVLAGVVNDVFPADARPVLIGPDADGAHSPAFYNISLPKLCDYIEAFVLGTNGILDAATFHEYIEVDNVTVLDPNYLDASAVNAAAVVAAVRRANATLPVWVGEIGPHTGDSPPDSLVADCHDNKLCGRFGSMLWYADALGANAVAGIARFARQDLIGGTYALINTSTPDGALFGAFTPSPDYYLLWVWRRTVGSEVLSITLPAEAPTTLRSYAFCARDVASAVALVLVNLDNATACVAAPDIAPAGADITLYTFTGGDAAGILSWTTRLNGNLLKLDAAGNLPSIVGVTAPAAGGIQVPPQSVSIVVVPVTGAMC